MAASIQDHIHLDTSTPPTTEYYVKWPEGWDYTPQLEVIYERGLTGKLLVHRLVDDSGDPIQFDEDILTLTITLAEMITLRALAGKAMYYVPNLHDDASLSSYIETCYFDIRPGMALIDPMGSYWSIQIQIHDNEAVS